MSIVTVKSYNEFADFCYSKLSEGENVFIEGYLNSNSEIIMEDINEIKNVTACNL